MNVQNVRRARQLGCTACVFYQAVGASVGECRIGAPRTSNGQRWPKVDGDDFCGCWEPAVIEEVTE